MTSRSTARALRAIGRRALGVALLYGVATCTDGRAPTAPQNKPENPLTAGPIAQTLLTSGGNGVNQSVYTTAAIAPAANALVLVAVRSRRSTGPLTPTLSGGGMASWTPVATVDYDPVSTPLSRLVVFRALSGAPGSGPLTITFANSVSNVEWIVSQWTGVDASGTNGSGAIVQSGSARGDAVATLSVALAAFGNAADVAYGALGAALAPPAVTPGAGFTEITEATSGESTLLEAEWGVNLATIPASLSSAKNAALIGIEIKAGGGGGGGGGVSAALSTVSAAPASIALGSESSTITVTVRDDNGNPLSGAGVVLAASGTGNTLTQPTGVTDGTGVATGTLSSSVAEPKTVSAVANGIAITQTAAVTVNPGGGGGGGTITQALLTSGSNAVNQAVYTTASIAPAANALITIAVLGRRSSGALTPAVTGGGMPGWTQVASVDYDPIGTPASRLVVFRALSGTPGSGPITISFASSVSNVTWVVSQWTGVDASGANGAGAIVQSGSARGDAVSTLSTTLAPFVDASDVAYAVLGASVNGPAVTPGAGFTEIAEPTSGESTVLETEWGVNLPTAQASLASAKNAALIGIEIKSGGGGGGGGGVSAAQSTVSAAPASIVAGSGSSTITVTAKDASGNPVSGATVVLAASGGGNTLTQPSSVTGADGVATGTLTSTLAQSKTISATANGVAITQTAPVTVTPGPVSASQSTVTASPTSFVAGGSSTITVTAKDANGNPIGDVAVVLAATGTGNTLTQPAGLTTGAGVAMGTLSSTVAELKTVSATIAGTAITQTAPVNVTSSGGGGGGSITQTLLTSGGNGVNQSVYTTASIAPAANALVTVAVRSRRSSGPLTPTLSGGGMASWTLVATVDYDPLSGSLSRLMVFRALSGAPGSGPLTIAFASSVSNVEWIVSQWSGVDPSGTNGSGAIAQTGSARGDAVATLSVPLAAFGNAGDVAYGALGAALAPPGVTPGSGFTEIAEATSGESTLLETEWGVNLPTIQASLASAKNAALIGIEIKAGGPVGPGPASLVLAPKPVIVDVGASAPTTVTVKDGNGIPISNPTVSYASRNGFAASVGAGGAVTGVNRGQAVIVATAVGGSAPADSLLAVAAVPGGPVLLSDVTQFRYKTDTVFTVTVVMDMRSSGELLGATTVSVTWNPGLLVYQSNASGGSGASPTVNASNTANGVLTLALADANGFAGRVELLKITFKAASAAGLAGSLALATSEVVGARTFTNLLPQTVAVSYPLSTR